ncbi:Elongator complex protein 5 [Xylogone sp. PMI_703]|nr:Elongator complex protein 5 [Xylogone sp. PMI_703]
MAPSPLQHRRTHNTLLFQKLLNLRDNASPLTLLVDTLEQRGGAVVREFAVRAKIAKSKIIFISFTTLRKPRGLDVDVFIRANKKPLAALRNEIIEHYPPMTPQATTATTPPQKILLIIDTLNPLASTSSSHLPTFLTSLLPGPQLPVSLIATYHADIPLSSSSPYAPDPLTVLSYLATAILYVHNLSHTIQRKKALDRSLQAPVWGLAERKEGVIIGLESRHSVLGNGTDGSVVVEMEMRRKSGRGVKEVFILSPAPPTTLQTPASLPSKALAGVGTITLLDDHPLYASVPVLSSPEPDEEVQTTFNLGLTEKQKRDREGVVLPYFDAQKEGGALGPGEGGRILYEMGEEDKEDFDDEEDEI